MYREVIAGCGEILLGRAGEHLATRVTFPVADWIEQFGAGGRFELVVHSSVTYIAQITVDDGNVRWIITNTDTAAEGRGACELYYYYADNSLAKSKIWQTNVLRSIDDSPAPVPPEHYAWVDEVLSAAQSVEEAVEHYPYIDPTTHHWMAWDVEEEAWYDTGVLAQGQDGAPGEDGFSPIVSITEGEGEHTLTIEDAEGEHSTVIRDGSDATVTAEAIEDALGFAPVSPDELNEKQDVLTDADKQSIVKTGMTTGTAWTAAEQAAARAKVGIREPVIRELITLEEDVASFRYDIPADKSVQRMELWMDGVGNKIGGVYATLNIVDKTYGTYRFYYGGNKRYAKMEFGWSDDGIYRSRSYASDSDYMATNTVCYVDDVLRAMEVYDRQPREISYIKMDALKAGTKIVILGW